MIPRPIGWPSGAVACEVEMDCLASPTDGGLDAFGDALQSSLSVAEISVAFLRTARSVLPVANSGFYRLDDTLEPGWVVAGVPDEFLWEYERIGRADDPVLQYVIESRSVIDSSRLPDSAAWERAAVRSVLASVGFHHSMQAPVIASERLLGTINFARSYGQAEFSPVDLRIAHLMGGKLGLAIERAERHARIERRASIFEKALDRTPQPLAISTLDGELIFVNRAATKLDSGNSETIEAIKLGPVAAATAEFQSSTSRLLTQAARVIGDERVIVRSMRLSGVGDTAVHFIYSEDRSDLTRLPGWDVLSPREQEIAQLVSEGLTTRQIAERAFITENTVKQHLKRMFVKTDSRNRAELLQQTWAAKARTTDRPEAPSDSS